MRQMIIAFTGLLLSATAGAQTGIGTTVPDQSARLDISSTTKGLLIPRMTDVEKLAIAQPAKGLLVFNTTTNQFEYNWNTPESPKWAAIRIDDQVWGKNSQAAIVTSRSGDKVGIGIDDNVDQKLTIGGSISIRKSQFLSSFSSTAHHLTTDDYFIHVTIWNGNTFTLNLPAAEEYDGQIIVLRFGNAGLDDSEGLFVLSPQGGAQLCMQDASCSQSSKMISAERTVMLQCFRNGTVNNWVQVN